MYSLLHKYVQVASEEEDENETKKNETKGSSRRPQHTPTPQKPKMSCFPPALSSHQTQRRGYTSRRKQSRKNGEENDGSMTRQASKPSSRGACLLLLLLLNNSSESIRQRWWKNLPSCRRDPVSDGSVLCVATPAQMGRDAERNAGSKLQRPDVVRVNLVHGLVVVFTVVIILPPV